MVQILGIRKYFNQKEQRERAYEAHFERGWRAESVDALLSDPEKYLKDIPDNEQWNLYFTVGSCHEEKGRKLEFQTIIPIDIDGIRIEGDEPLAEEIDKVLESALGAVGLDRYSVGSVFSGNGIWLYIGIRNPITDPDYFEQTRPWYKGLCARIDFALKRAGIQGATDPTAWSAARLTRMPGTRNIKESRPTRRAFVINSNIVYHDTDVKKLSGIQEIPTNQQIDPSFLRQNYPPADIEAIMDPDTGCKFLSWCQTNPRDVKEPQWYAMLSVTGRFPNGRAYSHKMSEGHPGYSYDETEVKLDHALMHGPRLCKGIEVLSDKCKECVHFNTTLMSPILIQGENFVATEHTGFHFMRKDSNGNLVKGKPDIDGLVSYFRRKNGTVVSEAGTGAVWRYTGQFYEEVDNDIVTNFAYEHFDPRENEHINAEFFNRVRRSGMRPKRFFADTTSGRVNFKNGVLDVATRSFAPHDESLGFRSVLAAEYDEKAICPNWEKFLTDVTLNDESLVKILQEFVGYIVASPDCRYQKGLALMGTGANGKSVFVNIIKKLVSKHGFSSVSLEDMQNPQNRLIMEGKLVNIAEENSYREAFKNTSTVKQMVTGGEVSVKRLYAQPYQYENTTKLVMLFNKLPRTGDDSEGFFRRLIMVPFDAQFSTALGNRDIHIERKLLEELPGILNWAVQGFDRLEQQGQFTHSERSEALLEVYKEESNPLIEFVNDYIVIGTPESKEYMLDRDELYAKYLEWAQDNGMTYILNKKQVFGHVREMFKQKNNKYPEEKRTTVGTKRKRSFEGMAFASESDF